MNKYLATLLCLTSISLYSVDVATEAELDAALSAGSTPINFTAPITLTTTLRPIQCTDAFAPLAGPTVINGSAVNTLSGGSSFRGFFVRGGTVTINDMTFTSTSGIGGAGGNNSSSFHGGGGGGGAGLGGGIFISDGATVTLNSPTFTTPNATGGSGGSLGIGGNGGSAGGGLEGNGGQTNFSNSFSGAGAGGFSNSGGDVNAIGRGGGGGGGVGTAGATVAFTDVGGVGGDNFTPAGGGAGGAPLGGAGGNATLGGAGGGGGAGADGSVAAGDGGDGLAGGGGAGGGGQTSTLNAGGNGGDGGIFGGGGGGGFGFDAGTPGNGGFAGGGGGGVRGDSIGSAGGTGGFGAGGGGGGGATVTGGAGGTSLFGGGAGTSGSSGGTVGGSGGGGAGFGGAIFIERGGTCTIAGAPVFTGSTTTAGTGGNPGTTAGNDIYMMSSADLTFDLSSNLALPNAIEGDQGAGGGSTATGGLTKRGSALLTLVGDNTYTGVTTVEAGELRLTSSVITDVVVDPGAIFSGSGTIKNAKNLDNSGTVAPGVNGVGTITLEGGIYTQTATGKLAADITPTGANDSIVCAASASIDGSLEVIANAGNYIVGTQYILIDAPTTGSFSSIKAIGPAAETIKFEVTIGSVVLTITSAGALFSFQNIDSGPPQAVVDCIIEQGVEPNTDFAFVVELLGTLNDNQVNTALTGISPVRFGALEWINARNNSYVADLIGDHLFELCCSSRNCNSCNCNSSGWVSIWGGGQETKKKYNNLRRFNADNVGILAGYDICCSDCLVFGGSVGYTHTDLLWRNEGGRGHLNSYFGALYGTWRCKCLDVNLTAIGGGSDQDMDRRITFSTLDRTAKSDFWSYFGTGHLGVIGKWGYCCSSFEPYVYADYHYYHRSSFKESGADSLNLAVKSKEQHMMRAEGGLKWYYEYTCECYCFAPYLGVSYVGEFPLHKSKQKATFKGEDCIMNVKSFDSAEHLGSPEAGIKWTHCNGFSFILGYKGLFNSKTRINQGEARVEWIF